MQNIETTSITVSDLGTMTEHMLHKETIDGGDHVSNIWSDGDNTVLSIQGTGDSVTLIRFN